MISQISQYRKHRRDALSGTHEFGRATVGSEEEVEYLARASVAVGVAGVFIETHQDPDNAPSDGPNMVPLNKLEDLLKQLSDIDNLIKN